MNAAKYRQDNQRAGELLHIGDLKEAGQKGAYLETTQRVDEWCGEGGRLVASAAESGEAELTENYISSNAKIKKALGVEKMPVRAKDGLRETIKSFAGE